MRRSEQTTQDRRGLGRGSAPPRFAEHGETEPVLPARQRLGEMPSGVLSTETILTIAVPAMWLLLLLALAGTEAGRAYWGTSTRSSAIPDQINTQMAYLRALDGKRAAARCRDCGQVFLILDGRRSTYCNAKCRNRFNVREFRARARRRPR